VIGLLRVFFGSIEESYYWSNHAFWGKMLAFLAMGLLTIPPTLAIRRWLKASAGQADYVPPAGEITASRRYIHLQAGVLVLIPIFAAAMARGYGA
jgi:putative membrane protein